MPNWISRLISTSIIGTSPRGTSGFGKLAVNGRNRTPLPPARMTAFNPEAAFLSLYVGGPSHINIDIRERRFI